MNINNRYNHNLKFGSKNSPIKPFDINTREGALHVEEIQRKDIKKLAKFANDMEESERFNYLTNRWGQDYQDYLKLDKDEWFEDTKNHYLNILDKADGNTTILVAKDQKSHIKAFFAMHSFDENKSSGLFDPKIGYLDRGYFHYKYTKDGAEQIMLYKMSQTAKGHFSDILAIRDGYMHQNIYKGVGFEQLDESNPIIKKISNYLQKHISIEGSSSLLSKSIDPKNPWWKRIAKQLK